MRYDVLPDDTVANPVKFLDAGIDGIKVDQRATCIPPFGAARFGLLRLRASIWVRCKSRRLLMEPRPRIVVTNLAFGDADSKMLYITACTHLFRIRLKVAGVRPGPQR